MSKSIYIRNTLLAITSLLLSVPSQATSLNLATQPLYLGQDAAPMMMLVMSRDHSLYYEAYNDASDINQDGVIDYKYKPTEINYSGYFDSFKCYEYSTSNKMFLPKSETDDKKCSTSAHWSGDYLNYLTMTRMDILRKVLYGGYRSTDSDSPTVLERVYVPQDAHSWAKAYTSYEVDGFHISDYAGVGSPAEGKKFFFGTATFVNDGEPELRHKIVNDTEEVWNWASTERPVLNGSYENLFEVRVKVCVEGLLESNCKKYTDGTNTYYKPTGLLHTYGEEGKMEFGLITGSYKKNLSGGVLRQAMANFASEVNSNTGQFKSGTGIVNTINTLRIVGFSDPEGNDGNEYKYAGDCGWITNRAITDRGNPDDKNCVSWGNPLGEMLYESLRYFSGAKAPSSSYDTDDGFGLTTVPWDDPYENRQYCAAAYNMVIGDPNPSYDSDQLPGSAFSNASYNGSVLNNGEAFNIATLLDTISDSEGVKGGYYFIGDSAGDSSNTIGAPTAKQVSNLSTARGLAPQEPTKEGSYSVAGVAHYGYKSDINPTKQDRQQVQTLAVALSSPLPQIIVPVGNDKITFIPYAKSVGWNNLDRINPAKGQFQPTNTIVDYYIESLSDDGTSGTFSINFEDVEQGADHDMDMIVKYSFEVINVGGALAVEFTIDSTYAGGGIDQHAGYIVSGSSEDGIYLDVKDKDGRAVAYYLDTLPGDRPYPNNSRNKTPVDNTDLPLTQTRIFKPSASSNAGSFLKPPLWYAAKWGWFKDSNNNFKPDVDVEWNSDKDINKNPDGYFPVTNPGELETQLNKAFSSVFNDGTASSVSPIFDSAVLKSGARRFQASFNSSTWSGDLKAFEADGKGGFKTDYTWSVAEKIDKIGANNRKVFSRNDDTQKVFEFNKIVNADLGGRSDFYSLSQIQALLKDIVSSKTWYKRNHVNAIVQYLKGSRYHELNVDRKNFRGRDSVLGDIVNSKPYIVGDVNGHNVKKPVIVFGANDGMVHIVDADNGKELAAYVPSQIYGKLADLTSLTYIHQPTVDGSLNGFTNENGKTVVVGTLGGGAKGLYAIDVSDFSNEPSTSQFLWEIQAKGSFAGIGYSAAAPTIAKLANGKVGVIFTNGYNSDETEGSIYIADLEDGTLIKKLETGIDGSHDPLGLNRPNAMSNPAVIDVDGDGVADKIYAGDLFGNMWSFDVSNSSIDNWGKATSDGISPLFKARSPSQDGDDNYIAQPITSRPVVAAHPQGLNKGLLVAFGTGKYIETTDNQTSGQATQSFYVLWDKKPTDKSLSQSTEISDVRAFSATDNIHEYSKLMVQIIESEDAEHRYLSKNVIDWQNDLGFYIDLINTGDTIPHNKGERQTTDAFLLTNKVSFTTLIPNSDPCVGGGQSWYMELNIHTGQTWRTKAHTLLDGIASSPNVIIIPPQDTDDTDDNCTVDCPTGEDGDDPKDEDEDDKKKFIDSNCVSLNNGDIMCFGSENPMTGQINWRQLY
ncbi:pilus assembly protein [Algibacillus agarilyticus]|uniref:pilus assembly protein n=1 Tax=Algibacillus agarilyticus TaxID=2234133 RepID=UPI000DD0DF4A|nr:PilC/PilY family type IV pilus protein [Algibacillus agarilyticus]